VLDKISFFIFSLLFSPLSAFAATNPKIKPNSSSDSLESLLNGVADYILLFLGALAVLFVIIAGIRLMVSSGNADEAKTAKQNLTYAIIGLIAVLFAKFVLILIIKAVGEVA